MLLFIAAIQLKIFLVFLICYLQVVMALLLGVDFVFYFINLVILEILVCQLLSICILIH